MKRYSTLTIIIVIIAILSVFGGAYLYYRSIPTFNNFTGAMLMSKSDENKDYNDLVEELNEQYLNKFCDILEEAKEEITKKTELVLGDSCKELFEKIKNTRDEIISMRERFTSSKELNLLKDELAKAKEALIEANAEEKPQAKSELNKLLKKSTLLNLKHFTELANKRREIDDDIKAVNTMLETKKDELKEAESQIILTANKKLTTLALFYATEIKTLSKVFDVDNYSCELPFFNYVDLNEPLIDFDKNAFLDSFRKASADCTPGCTHNCSGCSKNPNGYNTNEIDENDN